jgi:hypothetical protein
LVKTLAHFLGLVFGFVILFFFFFHTEKFFDFVSFCLFFHELKNEKIVLELLDYVFALLYLLLEPLLVFETHRHGLAQAKLLGKLLFNALKQSIHKADNSRLLVKI